MKHPIVIAAELLRKLIDWGQPPEVAAAEVIELFGLTPKQAEAMNERYDRLGG